MISDALKAAAAKRKADSDADALTRHCPTCGQPPGEWCVTRSYGRRSYFLHEPRGVAVTPAEVAGWQAKMRLLTAERKRVMGL